MQNRDDNYYKNVDKKEMDKAFTKALSNIKSKFDYTPKAHPKAYFTGGLPGAGKSEIVKDIKKEHKDIVVLDVDELRRYHPKIKEIQDRYGADAGNITHTFAVELYDKLKEQIYKDRANVIVEGTLSWSEGVKDDIVGQALKEGYNVQVDMKIVNSYEAMQGSIDRYIKMHLKNPSTARFVPFEAIESMAPKIEKSAKILADMKDITLKLTNRDNEVFLEKDIGSTIARDKDNNRVDIKDALKKNIDIDKWNPKKIEKVQKIWDETVKKMESINIPKDVKNIVIQTYKELNNNIDKYKSNTNKIQKSQDITKEKGGINFQEKAREFKKQKNSITNIQRDKSLNQDKTKSVIDKEAIKQIIAQRPKENMIEKSKDKGVER